MTPNFKDQITVLVNDLNSAEQEKTKQELLAGIELVSAFLEKVSKEKKEFEKALLNIQSTDKFNRVVQSIGNYNHQTQITDENIKFLFICIAAECFFTFNRIDERESRKNFKRFFKNLSKKTQDKIREKFKNHTTNKPLDTEIFFDYLYTKRCEFVHQGIHFRLNGTQYHDSWKDQPIQLNFTIQEFESIFIEGLLTNLQQK